MAELVFDGEIDSLTPSQKDLICKVLDKRKLKAKKIHIKTLGQAGDNYIADVKNIIAELDNGESFKIVAKVAPTNEMAREALGTAMLFNNECVVYNDILPKFIDIQRAAGLSPQDFFKYPECYGTLKEPLNEILLLEDLTVSNYKMLDRFTPLTNESIRLVLKNLAILHSLSYVFKKNDPDTFDSYTNKFEDYYSVLSTKPDTLQYFASVEADAISILESEEYKKAIRGTLSELSKHSAKILKYERNSRYSVIIHGDAWTNNMMFRFEGSNPVGAILIDYQLCKVGSPVNDLQYMIFNCSDYNTRHQYFYEWIDYYHSELDKSLSNFGMKANYVYPRDQLDADLRRYSKFYLGTIIMSHSMLIRKTEDAAKIKDVIVNDSSDTEEIEQLTASLQISNLDSDSIARFKGKIEELVQSYRELGFLE
ncbi:uncharacterized protein LOC106135579 [Amyelois transitella]|uniref:uncharacterized protein LOC106135579 n=1 Tax=Amyelois transitella TaxID=680683 RepID=UPI0029902FD0|nr:uncharacterized protein LOC106135579 [Amyelois transitella]